jgi:hypothetical protein
MNAGRAPCDLPTSCPLVGRVYALAAETMGYADSAAQGAKPTNSVQLVARSSNARPSTRLRVAAS